MTNKQLAYLGVGIGALGIVYELFLSPSAKTQIAAAKAAGKPLGPLGSRPLTATNTAPIVAAKASSATPHTTGNPSGLAQRPINNTSAGLTLGTSLLSGIAKLFGSSSPDKKAAAGSGGGGSSFGSAPSNANGGYGRPAAQGNDFLSAGNLVAAGAGPTQSSAYVDGQGFTAYPSGNGAYVDEDGNQVFIDSDGNITYDSTEDVGYVAGSVVFPDAYDPNDATTYDFGVPSSIAATENSDPNGEGSYLGDDTSGVLAVVAPGEGADTSVSDASDAGGIVTDDYSPDEWAAGGNWSDVGDTENLDFADDGF